ncbi:hypothetical protein AAY473_007892 [Plecturocebus cupreus]
MDCSDFPERQTSSKRRLSPVYSAPRAAEPRRRQKSRASRKGRSGSSKNLSIIGKLLGTRWPVKSDKDGHQTKDMVVRFSGKGFSNNPGSSEL